MSIYERSELLLGTGSTMKLANATVAVFGIGGVGGYVVEALARAGVGHIVIVDKDNVTDSNINRQIIALSTNIGQSKVEVMKERILAINPSIQVDAIQEFFLPENAHKFDFSRYDYVVDAVDTVTAKIEIIQQAKSVNTPVISCMGAGNKLDGTKFRVADIYETSVCPLAKVLRRELKKRNIKDVKVVYSTEEAISVSPKEDGKRPDTGSVSFVPGIPGLIMAGEVIKAITGN